jgi:hypothetical protein
VLDIKDIFDFIAPVGLRHAFGHAIAHVGCGIA